jgi:MerR family transcriptional regulator, light-induced transcriptional regulator
MIRTAAGLEKLPGSGFLENTMKNDRTYSTRELAQMWNVSESTIKRWADTGELQCKRTLGGHRKFRLEDICVFQRSRGFEATGMLLAEASEESGIEWSVNQKDFDKVRLSVTYLASQNQPARIKDAFERLYLRGMGVADLYDEVIIPVTLSLDNQAKKRKLSVGHIRLVSCNLEKAMYSFFPSVVPRRPNGKTALCAAADPDCLTLVNAASRVFESEGWECLNLGVNVPFQAMCEMVEKEPVNLVCVAFSLRRKNERQEKQLEELARIVHRYRIRLVLLNSSSPALDFGSEVTVPESCPTLRSLRLAARRASR